jgi:thiosulfate/3-mercaptopyruvate sulfurtransferase
MFKSFISPRQAKQDLLNDTDIKLLFTTLDSMSSNKPKDILQLDDACYIPGSVLFDFKNVICDKHSHLSNMMPSASQFQQQVSELGISNSDTIYVYDDFGNFCSSRVWFMFKSMGFESIFVIDGGLPSWLDHGFETTNKLNTKNSIQSFISAPSSQFRFVDAEYVSQHINTLDTSIIDARGEARFKGLVKEERENLRSGHIPSSVNLPYASFQSRQGMHSLSELKHKFEPYRDKRELIFSCGSGVTACILAQCAFEAYSSISSATIPILSVYDGSWSEWGADERF